MSWAKAHAANQARSVWTEERTKDLKHLWASGHSASVIAIHFDCGMTKNAVIGKVRRLGLKSRTTTVVKVTQRVFVKRESWPLADGVNSASGLQKRMAQSQQASHTGRKQAEKGPVQILSIIPKNAVSFFDVKSSQCRYPVGPWDVPIDRKMYCGEPKQKGSSFCSDHHLVCWAPHRRQVREAA